MKKVRNILTAAALTSILLVGTTFAGTGIIVAGLAEETNESKLCSSNEKVDHGIIVAGATGIIVAGFTGIIVAGFTGIIVAGASDTEDSCSPKVDHGIIVAG